MKKEKEIRGVAFRASVNEESRRVEGYALLFNVDSRSMWDGELIERVAPTALEGVLEKSDILCLMNHDERRGVLARYRMGEGSLSLEIDEKGLKYAFDAPNTALGDELLESLKRGDISESSFAFTVAEDHWERKADGSYVRTILKFERLYDVSPVYYPAYEDTTVVLRSLSAKKEAEQNDMEKRKREDFDNYINNLKSRF